MALLSPVNACTATARWLFARVEAIENRGAAKNFYRHYFHESFRRPVSVKTLVRQVFYRSSTRSVEILHALGAHAGARGYDPSMSSAGQPMIIPARPCGTRDCAVFTPVYPQCCPRLVHRSNTTYSSVGGEKGCLTTVSSGVEFADKTLSPARHGVYRFRFSAASFSRRGVFQEA